MSAAWSAQPTGDWPDRLDGQHPARVRGPHSRGFVEFYLPGDEPGVYHTAAERRLTGPDGTTSSGYATTAPPTKTQEDPTMSETATAPTGAKKRGKLPPVTHDNARALRPRGAERKAQIAAERRAATAEAEGPSTPPPDPTPAVEPVQAPTEARASSAPASGRAATACTATPPRSWRSR